MGLGHLGPDTRKRKYRRANKPIDAGRWELLGEKERKKLETGRGRKLDELNKRSN